MYKYFYQTVSNFIATDPEKDYTLVNNLKFMHYVHTPHLGYNKGFMKIINLIEPVEYEVEIFFKKETHKYYKRGKYDITHKTEFFKALNIKVIVELFCDDNIGAV